MLLDRIELFISVAKHNNLAKTAREMHVSASSVCQRLKTLETDFDVKLYKRSKYGIELTGAGQTLLTAGNDVLTQIKQLKNVFRRDLDVAPKTLTIGGTHTPSARHLPAAVAAFQKTPPNVKVDFLTARRATLEKLVQASEVDIAIIQSPSRSSGLHLEHFGVDHLVFFCHPNHPLTRKKRLEFTQLSNIPLIIRDGTGSTHRMLKQVESRGQKISVALRCISPDAVKAAVRRKMGVGILFSDMIKEEVKRKDFTILRFPKSITAAGNSYIAYSKKKPLSCTTADFLTLLRCMKTSATKWDGISDSGKEKPTIN